MVAIASVIKYEGDNSTFIWKHPCEDFNTSSQLIVHEAQEAILFLNLKAGDRMGHALVLGLDVEAYYKHRNCRVVMSKQNILDNVMWLHRKACTLGILTFIIGRGFYVVTILFFITIHSDS